LTKIHFSNTFTDTCLVFKNGFGDTLTFNRNVEVLKNTFQDTINIGFNLLYPGDKKKIFILQSDTSTSKSMYYSAEFIEYINQTKSTERLTKFICIYNLSKKWIKPSQSNQTLIVKVRFEK
jgi:hypothetical protein